LRARFHLGESTYCHRKWDLRAGKEPVEVLALKGHADSVIGLNVSPDNNYLLSNSMDQTLRIWDIRPFASNQSRCERVFEGSTSGSEKGLLRCSWSADKERVTCGSADR
jgi:Prp8 binding protein